MRSVHAVAIFCEDMRDELGNKRSLMGVLPDTVNIQAVPGRLMRMGVFVRINIDAAEKDVEAISVILRFPDGTEQPIEGFSVEDIKVAQKRAEDAGIPWAGFVVSALAANVELRAAGLISAIVKVGNEAMVCGGLNLRLRPKESNDPSTASGPPPERFPSGALPVD